MCFRPAEVDANEGFNCPTCGADNPPGEKKCIECGADMSRKPVSMPKPASSGAITSVPGVPAVPKVPTVPVVPQVPKNNS